jgi:DNA-binding response OmpR family regulator
MMKALMMPVKDGIETIREIRKCDPETPILAISGTWASADHLYLNAAKKLGAHVTLSKPFLPADLQRAVDSLLACEEPPALRSIGMHHPWHSRRGPSLDAIDAETEWPPYCLGAGSHGGSAKHTVADLQSTAGVRQLGANNRHKTSCSINSIVPAC